MKTTFVAIFLVLTVTLQAQAAEEIRVSKATVTVAPSKAPAAKAASAAPIWRQEASDLKPDPNAVWGRLDNGLRYVVLPNRDAPGRPSLQLYMRVGSLMEADDQRGMAHFLEHMAFNGTKHFPAGEMIEYFQRLGMSFVVHTNAATDFEKTVYKLELPRTTEEMTGEGLKLFRDFLDGMLLEKKEIERERHVILAEILARNTADSRAAEDRLGFLLPDTLVPRRWTAGTVETVRALAPQRFVDFYETWYTPGRAVIVATGNFDSKMVERLVRQYFQGAKARRGEQPDPSLGQVSLLSEPTAKVHVDREAQAVSVFLSRIAPASGALDSFALRREGIVRGLANAMLNTRFEKLAAAKEAPIQAAFAHDEQILDLAEVSHLSAVCSPTQWKAALGVLEQEFRRAAAYGFTDTEFAEAKTTLLAQYQAVAEQEETRQSGTLAAEIIETLARQAVFTHPADDLALVKTVLVGLKKDECEDTLRKKWESQDVRIYLQGNLPLEGNSPEPVLASYRHSRGSAVRPPIDEKAAKWAYTDFGPAGQIVKRREQKDLDFVEAVFANNVRVNVKRTQNEKNRVRVMVRFGGGFLETPADMPGLTALATDSFIDGGLQAHSVTELNRILADKNWGITFVVGEDAFALAGGCAPAALETELQVCAAYLTAPGYRPEARKPFLEGLESRYAQIEHTPEGAMGSSVYAFLRSNDPRFCFPTREVVQKLTLDDLKAWLAEPLKSGYMEVAIVGDVDPNQALQLVAKTLGALPPRAAMKPNFTNARDVKFPAAPKNKDVHFDSETPRALSVVCWPTPGGRDISRNRRIALLAEVLNDRLRIKVRQELGATYTPEVLSYSSDAFPDFGFVLAAMTVDSKRAAEMGNVAAEIAGDMATGVIGDDEFQRVMKPLLTSLDDVSRDNGYWVNLLGNCQEHPEFLEAARGRKADYQSITKADLESLAKQLFAVDKATIINVTPTTQPKLAEKIK
jgi:zinc protease